MKLGEVIEMKKAMRKHVDEFEKLTEEDAVALVSENKWSMSLVDVL